MSDITLIMPGNPSKLLLKMVSAATKDFSVRLIKDEVALPALTNSRLLFAIELDEAGYNIPLFKIMSSLWTRGSSALSGSTASLLIHSDSELFTKTVSQDIIFKANQLGCQFPGRPLVEATGSLSNLLTMQKSLSGSLEEVCLECSSSLGKSLTQYNPQLISNPNILVLHASSRNTSNTMRLWDMISKHLSSATIKEIHIENGTVKDCIGCPYKTCKHYGKQTSCFYGGIMVEEVYPAVLEADAVVWLCPNYNDAITANLSAVINRLTALFRKTKFYDKSLFGVIVSGNSGSDAVAKQLISALNINKTFRLPPYFSIMATANDKDAILKVPDIENKAKEFAMNISREIKA